MKKNIYSLAMFAIIFWAFIATPLRAQVTIGSLDNPQNFSLLELISSGTRGMRLPQLTTAQRDAITTADFKANALAQGLQIFNTTTKCVETWNGTVWIQKCGPEGPEGPATPPEPAFAPAACGITPNSGTATTFACIADPNAVEYEWFVDGEAGSTITTVPTVTYASEKAATDVTVQYLFEPSFLKPTMIAVEGTTNPWTYGDSQTTTDADIPSFQMSRTEITQAQFSAIFPGKGTTETSSATSYYFCCAQDVDYAPSSAKPAEYVSWYDAIAYCNKLSIAEGKEPCYSVKVSGQEVDWENLTYAQIPSGSSNSDWDAATCNFNAKGYRLPTEWEWEYAARGGAGNAHPVFSGSSTNSSSDNAALDSVGWFTYNNGSSGAANYGTKPVATKKPNVLGLYDMSGNVWEWCWNWYNENSGAPFPTPGGTVSSAGSSGRVIRGGYWYTTATACRVSGRTYYSPYSRSYNLGFRVVCKAN